MLLSFRYLLSAVDIKEIVFIRGESERERERERGQNNLRNRRNENNIKKEYILSTRSFQLFISNSLN